MPNYAAIVERMNLYLWSQNILKEKKSLKVLSCVNFATKEPLPRNG
ncbi:hypothetical protein ACR72M_17735 [Xenorhabdus bovienii]